MIITAKAVYPPSGGGNRTVIVTTDGQRLGCWPELAGIFEKGGSYDVAIEESHHEGRTYYNIKKAAPAAAPAASAAQGAAAAFRSPEQISVTEITCAYIAAGACPPAKLADVIRQVRQAWGQNFGDAPITGYRRAAE